MPSSSEVAPADQLSPNMTLAEALDLAMGFERTAYRFYSSLVEKVRQEIQPLVRELATEEKNHYELLKSLSRDKNLARYLSDRTEKPTTTDAFTDYVNLPELPDDPLEDSLLEYAESRERIAYEHYGFMAELTPPGPLKDLFEFLRDEEQRHHSVLQSRQTVMFSIF